MITCSIPNELLKSGLCVPNPKDSDFERSDRETKNDFTATTTTYLVKELRCQRRHIKWFEWTRDGELVPFGSPLAWARAPFDAILIYKDKYYYYFELKGRWKYSSTDEKLNKEGSYTNKGKIKNLKRISEEGKVLFVYYKEDEFGETIKDENGNPIFDHYKIYDTPKGHCCWGELYNDDIVRVWWNLEKIGLDNLMPTDEVVYIKETEIDSNSEKKAQKRGRLEVDYAKVYKRVEGGSI